MFFIAAATNHANHAGPALSMDAPVLFEVPLGGFSLPITNSMIYAWIIALLIIVAVRVSLHKMREVPAGAQNVVEAAIEGLENLTKGLLEAPVARMVFPLISTFFIFILISNYMGLMPGVGSIGWGHHAEHSALPFAVEHVDKPLFRPPTADANMTLAMALIFFVANIYWSIRYNGFGGFVHHIFGVKGGLTGGLAFVLSFVFFVVGLIEVMSILIRPVALAMRLYGNVYGGESVLTIMLGMLPGGIAAVPFYFFELIVATVQATVFTILCIAFTASMCSHAEESHHSSEEGHSA